MRSIAPLFAAISLVVTGCAVAPQEGAEEPEPALGTQDQALLTIDSKYLSPQPTYPWLTPPTLKLSFTPAYASTACHSTGAPPTSFLVRRAAKGCLDVSGSGGTWSRVRTVALAGPISICQYQWSGTGSPDWSALEAAAIKVPKTLDGGPVPDVTGVCTRIPTFCMNAALGYPSTDCVTGPMPERLALTDMGGCTSCGVTGYSGYFAVLTEDQSTRPWWTWTPTSGFAPMGQQVVYVSSSTGTTDGTILSFH